MPRTKIIKFRASEEEYTDFRKKAEATAQPLSALLRDSLKGVKIRHRKDERRWLEWLLEHKRVNNNINQLARYCNTLREEADAGQVALHLYGFKQSADELLEEVKRAL